LRQKATINEFLNAMIGKKQVPLMKKFGVFVWGKGEIIRPTKIGNSKNAHFQANNFSTGLLKTFFKKSCIKMWGIVGNYVILHPNIIK